MSKFKPITEDRMYPFRVVHIGDGDFYINRGVVYDCVNNTMIVIGKRLDDAYQNGKFKRYRADSTFEYNKPYNSKDIFYIYVDVGFDTGNHSDAEAPPLLKTATIQIRKQPRINGGDVGDGTDEEPAQAREIDDSFLIATFYLDNLGKYQINQKMKSDIFIAKTPKSTSGSPVYNVNTNQKFYINNSIKYFSSIQPNSTIFGGYKSYSNRLEYSPSYESFSEFVDYSYINFTRDALSDSLSTDYIPSETSADATK